MTLAPATFLGAFAVGLLASLARPRLHEPRIALTVPGNHHHIMVPGTHAFQTVVLFDQGDTLAAMQAAVLGRFVVGAMALGLAVVRFVSDRGWAFETCIARRSSSAGLVTPSGKISFGATDTLEPASRAIR
jgi:uncharacterized membrane protein YjjB (DUF3815 family)